MDVSEIAEPVIDIWPYVEMLSKEGIVSEKVVKEFMVEKVYRTLDYSIEHVILETNNTEKYVAIVINRNAPEIIGHYLLFLNENYYG